MGYPDTRSLTVAPRASAQPVQRRRTRVALAHCLIVSQSKRRSKQFEQAAVEGGWKATVRNDIRSASEAAARLRFHLAIVDLDRSCGTIAPGFRQLVELLAGEDGLLLVVCGNDGDALEEIWAHQLGAWLFLPGVDETSNLAMLCSEARAVVEKLHPQLAFEASSKAIKGGH